MKGGRSFIEQNLSRFTHLLEENLFADEVALQKGWLQEMDPRAKIVSILLLLLSSAFSHSMMVIAVIYLTGLILSAGSRLFSFDFLKRIWVFMPLYTTFIAFPALFLTPGDRLFQIPFLSWIVTRQGFESALFLVLRVATSVSLMLLLVLTTSWPVLLKALRSLGFPKTPVLLLSMTYRYIYVLLHTANSMFLARKSRKVGPEKWQSMYVWTGTLMGTMLGKSYRLGSEVYLAMQARGFRGEPAALTEFQLKPSDIMWMFLLITLAGVTFYFGYWRMM